MTRELAKVGDPLVASNGDLLTEEADEDAFAESQLPPSSTPVPYKDFRPDVRRVLSDLRAPTDMLNVTNVVLSYTLCGISDTEIMEATKLSAEQILQVRESRIYADIFETIMRTLINANSEYIECRIAAYSGMALSNVADIAQRSKNTGHRLTASKDLLDRAGHRPQDRAASAGQGMNELHIVITDSKDEQTKIDLSLKGRGNGHSS